MLARWPNRGAAPQSLLHDMIHLLTAIGLSPGGSITAHIYTQTIHRTTQITITTKEVDGSEWSASRPCRFTPGNESRYPLNTKRTDVLNKIKFYGNLYLTKEFCS